MVRRGEKAHSARCLACAAMLAFLGGCFAFGGRHQMDAPLSGGSVTSAVKTGVTTKQNLLERFGPPTAVARRGTTMVYPPPGPAKRGRLDIQSEAFLELFSEGRALKDSEIVYYYESSRTKRFGFLFFPVIIGAGHNSTRVVQERLWVLLDGTTGIVRDYVYRK